MADGIDVKVSGLEELIRSLNDAGNRQIPFATAVALTRTAQDCRKALIAGLPDDFTIRTRWIERGIRINPAKKSRHIAEVGSKDDFMRLQAEGGEKKSASGKAMGVPVTARRSPRSILRPSQWPGKLLLKNKFFKMKLKKSGKWGVWSRKGKKRFPIRLWYVLDGEVKIPKRWEFYGVVSHSVDKVFERNFKIALMEAIRTAKPPMPVE